MINAKKIILQEQQINELNKLETVHSLSLSATCGCFVKKNMNLRKISEMIFI